MSYRKISLPENAGCRCKKFGGESCLKMPKLVGPGGKETCAERKSNLSFSKIKGGDPKQLLLTIDENCRATT